MSVLDVLKSERALCDRIAAAAEAYLEIINTTASNLKKGGTIDSICKQATELQIAETELKVALNNYKIRRQMVK